MQRELAKRLLLKQRHSKASFASQALVRAVQNKSTAASGRVEEGCQDQREGKEMQSTKVQQSATRSSVGARHVPSVGPCPLAAKQAPFTQRRLLQAQAGLTSTRGVVSSTGPFKPASWWMLVPVAVGLAAAPHLSGVNIIHAYNTALQAYPFYTKMATGVTGAVIGDFVAQAFPVVQNNLRAWRAGRSGFDSMPFTYDPMRAGRFVLFSAVFATPCAVTWFGFLDRMIYPEAPTAITTVATKVAMDQLLMSPLMTTLFFCVMTTLQGKGSQAIDVVKAKLWPTMKLNYSLWPLAHVINFSFVPSDQRILYINCVAILWSVILSSMAAAPTTPAQREIAESKRS